MTVAKASVLANVQTKPRAPYQAAVISEDIRRIFALGYFTDVKVDVEPSPEGLAVRFLVTEKPIVRAIEVEGHRALRTSRILELLGISEGQLYDPRQVKEGVEAIQAEYARKGFSSCRVVWDARAAEGVVQELRLSLVVDEGPRMRIRRILIEGNQALSDRQIRQVMKTKRARWFRSGVYDEQVLEEDRGRVQALYRRHGHQDIQVRQEVLRDPSARGLYVHLTVQEGPQYRVGEIRVEGAVLFPERELKQALTLTPGAVYSEEGVAEDRRALTQYYGDRGHIHAQIAVEPRVEGPAGRVHLTYRISEREAVTIHRIDIRGNLRTKDVVVRRELRVAPGQRFDGAKIRKSLERLYNLGYFEEVNVETEPSDRPDREDLVVKVKEAKTGSFSFGGGFSSVDRLVGLIELEQRNFDWRNAPQFTGAGQDLRLRAEVGTVRRYFDISFTEPWIFGRPLSFGIDAYNRTRLRSSTLGLAFEEERRGGGVRLGKEFADVIHAGLNYQLFRTDISDVVAEASPDLKAEEGRNTISVIGASLDRDTRNNRFDPTQGSVIFGSADLAGSVVGGDRDFWRLQAGASRYWPQGDRFVLESRVRAGWVDAYDDSPEVPIFERFFGGGSGTIRGFRERRVGPRDPLSNDPIGGEATLVAGVEEVLTVVKDERDRPVLKAAAFVDVGDVWRRVGEFGESFKTGAGVGMRVNTPIGPIRLDLGFPVTEEEDGESRKPRFHFNISRSF
jgi:outer membrane protein insertion porin family